MILSHTKNGGKRSYQYYMRVRDAVISNLMYYSVIMLNCLDYGYITHSI